MMFIGVFLFVVLNLVVMILALIRFLHVSIIYIYTSPDDSFDCPASFHIASAIASLPIPYAFISFSSGLFTICPVTGVDVLKELKVTTGI